MEYFIASDSFWIMFTGALVAVSCGLLGCYLVLRQMAMIGDAISHAVLPGIVIAFLLTNSLSSVPAVLGAASVGLFSTFLIETVHRKGRLQSDASIGMIFTFMFALGVIMIAWKADNVDLDQECVLYGEVAFVTFDPPVLGMPVSTLILLGNLLLIALFIGIGYRGLFLTTFDPSYAKAIGISTAFWHYSLMGMVSMTSVVSFESVGAILVVAFLIGPAAIAHLLTDRMPVMLSIATVSGIIASIGGYYLASYLNASVAGAMTSVLGIEFIIVLLLAPGRGLLRTSS
ncbi:MAG: manganese/zinc/iron transport system permease protein [Limisphaerales bacterium]|jgi:manganese/zinc/iron transport system permease protein